LIHDRRIIHRDIKPANIIQNQTDGKYYLVDFGAAKVLTGTALLKTGTTIGSVEYTAPEQIRGKAVFASDIYSLGVTCLYLLTNVSPFSLIDADNQWVWRDWLQNNLVDRQLGQVLDRAIASSVNQRYASATSMLQDLNAAASKKFKLTPLTLTTGLVGGAISLFLAQFLVPKSDRLENLLEPTQILEAQAMEGLLMLTDVEGKRYLQIGRFSTTSEHSAPMSPSLPFPIDFAKGHAFYVQKIGKNGLQITALARRSGLKNFVSVIWGGVNSEANRQKIDRTKLANDDFGVLSFPSIGSESKFLVQMNYCESNELTAEYPPLAIIPESIPIAYQELACPVGYSYSPSVISFIGRYSAQVKPALVIPRE
jgi:hypothetical protein